MSLDFCNQHAFSWDHGTLSDLGTLGESFSVVVWLNNAGEAVGGANNDESFHATLINKRETLEKQFTIKIRLPSELLLEIEAAS